jgi:Uma2 family endonuclease
MSRILETILPLVQEGGHIQINPSKRLTDEELLELSVQIEPYNLEVNTDKTILIVSPTASTSGRVNSRLSRLLDEWAEKTGLGYTFDSSSGFNLPNGSIRMPDASFVEKERYDKLSLEEIESMPHICPDFVAEIRSKTDQIGGGGERDLLLKMQEYVSAGIRLGWLIDPTEEKAYIFRPGKAVETVDTFDATLQGEHVLPGFQLQLSRLRFSKPN